MNRTRFSLVLAAMALALVGATGLTAIRRDGSPPTIGAAAFAQVATRDQAIASNASLADGFRAAASRALPGVVHIRVEFGPEPDDDERGRGRGGPRPPTAGSGFVLSSDGLILTNNHVVERGRRITVVTQDRHELVAELVGRDPNTDVAVIRVDAKGLTEIPLGNSDSVEVGDWAIALGYPLDLGSTATAGIVSAKGRNIDILRRTDDPNAAPLESFIQTDAAINPGNSGGPLVDLNGRVVGMNSAIASRTGFFAGYGFAVPINLVRRIADDLVRYGEARRPRLGVYITTVDEADAMVYGLPSVAGAEVGKVESGAPAARAGLEQGDVIVSVDGKSIETDSELMELVAQYRPGQKIRLGVIRYGERIEREIELGQFPPVVTTSVKQSAARPWPDGISRFGFTAAAADSAAAAAFGGRDAGSLVVVQEVDPRNIALRSRLGPGWVIEAVNRQPVRGVADMERIARTLEPGDAVSLLVRDGQGETAIINYIVR